MNSGFAHAFDFFDDPCLYSSVGEIYDPFVDDPAYVIRRLFG